VGALTLGASSAALAQTETPIPFTETAGSNIQANLIASGPSGNFTTSNSYATPSSIPTTGNNFAIVSATDPLSIAGLSIANATDVYTLMNAYAPPIGADIGAITFSFSDGTSESTQLIDGSNIRDWYQGAYGTTFSSPNVENAFAYTNTTGGAASGNSATGDFGTYNFDEQDFSLGSFADGKVLTGIDITSVDGFGSTGSSPDVGGGAPIVLGVTVASDAISAAPEPSTWFLMIAGIGGAGLMLRRAKNAFGLRAVGASVA